MRIERTGDGATHVHASREERRAIVGAFGWVTGGPFATAGYDDLWSSSRSWSRAKAAALAGRFEGDGEGPVTLAPGDVELLSAVVERALDGPRPLPAEDWKIITTAPRETAVRIAEALSAATREVASSAMGDRDAVPTILEWGGGPEAFRRWLDVFYDLIEQEPEIAPLFGGVVSEQHRAHAAAWWVEVMGGPADYTERHGGYERMLAHHGGLAITPEQRLRFVTLLSQAADDAGLPDDPEFRAAIIGYAEWGSRLAVHNSQPGAEVVAHAPVPRWDWGVAPPYQP